MMRVEPQRMPASAAYFRSQQILIYSVEYGSLFYRLLFVTDGLTSSAQVHEFYCLHVVVYLSNAAFSVCIIFEMTVLDARI